jgi:hypothetical protein
LYAAIWKKASTTIHQIEQNTAPGSRRRHTAPRAKSARRFHGSESTNHDPR